jgi:nitrogen fixation protein NifQ
MSATTMLVGAPQGAAVPLGVVADQAGEGEAVYIALMGRHPGRVTIDADGDFDRHVLASLVAVAWVEGGSLAERLGLDGDSLARLFDRWFPRVRRHLLRAAMEPVDGKDDEVVMVRELLLAHRSTPGDEGHWLACMIARRAMEPNHLWEDLGLRDRGELSRLLTRHFAPLAVRNTNNMRWKRFFYRALCEGDGLVMCSTPVCASCDDFDLCFGQEDGESRLAHTRRRLALEAAAA